MGFKIGVLGPLNIDLIIKGQAPLNIKELNTWSGPSDIHIFTAGAAGYISQDLKEMGNDVHLVSCIGDDTFGKMILDILKKSGINIKYILVEQGKECALAIFILLFGSDKRPLTFRLPTHSGWPPKFGKKLEKYLLNADLLHSAGYYHFPDLWNEDIVALFKKAKAKGLITSMDPQFPLSPLDPPWIKILKPLIPYIDILMVDQQEALNIADERSIEEAANILLEQGFKIITIKLGDKGVLVKDASIMKQIPAIKPKKFVDTIGAGDAFDAGFLHAILEGKNVIKSAEIGVLRATESIQNVGGNINLSSIEKFI
jgi:2-dehydro-3-deoxygluconokinase